MMARPCANAADRAAVRALLDAARDPYETSPAAGDVDELLDPAIAGGPVDAVLWLDGNGRVVGFAAVSTWDCLLYRFLPGELTAAREDELMGWALAVFGRRPANEDGSARALEATARDENRAKVALLQRYGFALTGEEALHMARPLTAGLPEAPLPAGYRLRAWDGEREVEAYVALHRAAYGTENMTAALRREILRQAAYRPELDLVVNAADGAPAAFCVGLLPRPDEGEVAIVGVHPAHRGRGLGRAVVAAGLERMRALGAQRAILGVSGGHAAARRVYEALGFAVEHRVRWYARTV